MTSTPAFELAVLTASAIASNESLLDRLVLKGGNALQLIHQLGARASMDLDYSMEGDVEDAGALGRELEAALASRFSAAGYALIDFRFGPKPSSSGPGVNWGGYHAEFKVLAVAAMKRLEEELRRREAKKGAVPNPAQVQELHRRSAPKRTIDISKFEFCQGKAEATLINGQRCFVYTPAMIAAEKLRALCQQMDEYEPRKNPASRARDFYDLHACVHYAGVDLTMHRALLAGIFASKDVPLTLLRLLAEERHREFHRRSWSAVEAAVTGEVLESFDFYFEFVCAEVARLQAAGMV
ncbi:nucleotidyl transferase AbiEii/AbiGii toxin family protein [Corallococcus coralloides]|uniref:nucleotidyl transferase AbiEii/AbiGii toxin family protein n=1 Tax=Corallococcus coralloides TaxID=184914 RepID=UPI0038512CFD